MLHLSSSTARRRWHLQHEKAKVGFFFAEEFNHYLAELITTPNRFTEDGLGRESDWAGFKHQTELLGDKLQPVSDDSFSLPTLKIPVEAASAARVANSGPHQVQTKRFPTETSCNQDAAKDVVSHSCNLSPFWRNWRRNYRRLSGRYCCRSNQDWFYELNDQP